MTSYKNKGDESKKTSLIKAITNVVLTSELDWFQFETKMRHLVREILNPVLNKTEEAKERYFELEKKTHNLVERLELLEYSCFNNNKTKGPTIFESIF